MAYYLLTSKQFNVLTTLSSEEKKKKSANIAKSSYVYESDTPPPGLTRRDAISRRDLITIMKGTEWRIADPDEPSSIVYL